MREAIRRDSTTSRFCLRSVGSLVELDLDGERWLIDVHRARRWFVTANSCTHPVTELTGTVSRKGEVFTVELEVNCGRTPPTFMLRDNTIQMSRHPRLFLITHEQQETILDSLEAHVRSVGLPNLPSREAKKLLADRPDLLTDFYETSMVNSRRIN